jgi:hypothetical protein
MNVRSLGEDFPRATRKKPQLWKKNTKILIKIVLISNDCELFKWKMIK